MQDLLENCQNEFYKTWLIAQLHQEPLSSMDDLSFFKINRIS